MADMDVSHLVSEYGHPWYFFHRVDLRGALKELAFGDGDGPPAQLNLQAKAVSMVYRDLS